MEFSFAGVSVSSYTIHSLMLCGIKLCIFVINSNSKIKFQQLFLAIQCLINHLLFDTEIQIQVNESTTLAQLKEELVPLIGVPPTGFIVYRIRYNKEFEMERMSEIFGSGSEEHVCVLF